MQKRIIYRPKTPLFIIDDSYKSEKIKEKFCLITKDGKKITRDMMDMIELSDDSEDECINLSTNLELKDVNESIRKSDSKEIEKSENFNQSESVYVESKNLTEESGIKTLKSKTMHKETEKLEEMEIEEYSKIFESKSKVESSDTNNGFRKEIEKEKEEIQSKEKELIEKMENLSIHSLLGTKIYTLDEIFGVKERQKIEIRIDKSIFKDFKPSRKRIGALELFRYELNNVALSNYDRIINKLKNINPTDDEMKIMAELLYEKAVEEPNFTKIYALMVKQLKIFFKEKNINSKENQIKKKSVFMKTILKCCEQQLKTKQNWYLEKQFKDENEREEFITQQKKIKNKMLGTVKFVAYLYTFDVISFQAVNGFLKYLVENLKEIENMEILCNLIVEVSDKFLKTKNQDVLIKYKKIIEDSKNNYDKRIYYMILDTVDNVNFQINKYIDTGDKNKKEYKNTFEGLKNKEDKLENKNTSENNNEQEFVENENIKMFEYIKANLDENFPDAKQNLIEEFKSQNNSELFIESFILVIIQELNNFDSKLDFFIEVSKNFNVDFKKIFLNVNENLEEILLDCPFASKNFDILKDKLENKI